MRRRGRRDLFPPDRGLQVRMALAFVVSLVLVAALLASLVWLTVAVEAGWAFVFFVLCFAVGGALGPEGGRFRERSGKSHGPDELRHRAQAAADRLCLLGDLPRPEVRIAPGKAPASWITAKPWGTPVLRLTEGLVEHVDDEQLSVVVAHELSHVANGDAALMTFVAGPPTWILRGVRDVWESRREDRRAILATVFYGSYSALLALPAAFAARILSRHRELAADRGAAILTGSPAAVAATLIDLSGELAKARKRDLRTLGAGDLFYLLPARRNEARGPARLWATHPRLEKRVARLQQMERG